MDHNRRMGVGIIAQDHNGWVSTTLCKQVSLMPEPTTREAMGALLAAEFSSDMGLQDILHEGNSMNAVNAILQPLQIWLFKITKNTLLVILTAHLFRAHFSVSLL
jgi:hypothetical protein